MSKIWNCAFNTTFSVAPRWPTRCLYCTAATCYKFSHTVYAGTGSETDSEKIRSFLVVTKSKIHEDSSCCRTHWVPTLPWFFGKNVIYHQDLGYLILILYFSSHIYHRRDSHIFHRRDSHTELFNLAKSSVDLTFSEAKRFAYILSQAIFKLPHLS